MRAGALRKPDVWRGIDPENYLRNVLSRIADHPINRIEELLPWNVASKHTNRDTRGALSEDAIRKDSAGSPLELPYITELIEEGQITIGVIRPVGESVAVANDGESTLAMLVRRDGETLSQLLKRLELAIARARTEDVFIDEINSPIDSKRP
jgi:hypothetical protein